MNYWHAETTRASIYRIKLNTPEAWVALFAHSWPGGHQFRYNNGNSWDTYYGYEYTNQNPPANFYNHFACSFARYTDNGYGGGRAIFNQSYGLTAVGSTKTGSMLEFYYFYYPLSQQKTLGQAFKDWLTHITSNGVSFDELCWHYGMTLLGDPWLKPTGHGLAIAEYRKNIAGNSPIKIIGNPSRAQVIIQLKTEPFSSVKLEIYDCLGKKVKKLIDKTVLSQNDYEIIWRFDDDNGRQLPVGVYTVDAEIAGRKFMTNLVRLK